jgi:putative transcriptional regulator
VFDPDSLQTVPIAKGTLLVASPRLLDPNFMHSVVLLCDHGDGGAYGLIVNRPGPLAVADLHSDLPLLEGRPDTLWHGGPVATEAVQVLHGIGAGIPESTCVVDDSVWVGADPAVLHAALEGQGESSRVRFVVGYSGWSSGQLEHELREGAWVTCPARAEHVFDPEPETLWRRVLRELGGPLAGLADVPPDPSWN